MQLKLSNRDRETLLEPVDLPVTKHNTCVYCGSSDIIVLLTYDNRGPPKAIEQRIKRKLHKIKTL